MQEEQQGGLLEGPLQGMLSTPTAPLLLCRTLQTTMS